MEANVCFSYATSTYHHTEGICMHLLLKTKFLTVFQASATDMMSKVSFITSEGIYSSWCVCMYIALINKYR